MSILAPIVILLCYRRKNFLLFTVTSVAALAQLYLMGTRLAFFSIAVAALGVPVVLVLTGKARAPSATLPCWCSSSPRAARPTSSRPCISTRTVTMRP